MKKVSVEKTVGQGLCHDSTIMHDEVKGAEVPSMDKWIKEAKQDKNSGKCGMYLFHNGVVRETAKEQARFGIQKDLVKGMYFTYQREKVEEALKKAKQMPGIYYVRVWLNEGNLAVGDDIMYVLVGGDIRANVIHALQALVEELKTKCVIEQEK